MSTFISPMLWYIITIGILVTVHEWGHFIVARWCGVHVERFSIGFGRPLYKRLGKNGTEYQLAMIPLGGYVKMLDEREQAVSESMKPFAFSQQSVRKRIAIVIAGPLANLFLCILLLWTALTLGVQELRPVLGPSQGLALSAGFTEGDEITAIGHQSVRSWNEVLPRMAIAAMDQQALEIQTHNINGVAQVHHLELNKLASDFDQTQLMNSIGFSSYFKNPSPIIGQIQTGSAADGRLQIGDTILRIAGTPVEHFQQIPDILAQSAEKEPALDVEVWRQGRLVTVQMTPHREQLGDKTVWRLGIGSIQATQTVQYGFFEAIPVALQRTYTMARDSFSLIGRLLTGKASINTLSGPIGIAQAAGNQAAWGISVFLSFLAAISLALCIMNLLPIPVLDGGHLFYYLIEWATGKPVPERIQVAGQYVGIVLLAGLFFVAIFNDFFRIIS